MPRRQWSRLARLTPRCCRFRRSTTTGRCRCIKYPTAVSISTLRRVGSVLGCLLLYTIMRRGGQAVLRRRFKRENIERGERAYGVSFFGNCNPAVLAAADAFKIFVATAGTLEYRVGVFAHVMTRGRCGITSKVSSRCFTADACSLTSQTMFGFAHVVAAVVI